MFRIAHPFRHRLPAFLSAADWQKIAWAPSYRAPRAEDVLHPPPFVPPAGPCLDPAERRCLDAVLADPDADAPRLAYADWLSTRGNSQGAILRDQVLTSHEEVTQVAPEWLAPWSPRDLCLRKGFIEGMSLSGRAFISLGAALFDDLPLRAVRLVAIAWYMQELASTPHLARLQRLNLTGNRIDSAGIRALLQSPFVQGLQVLDLSGNRIGAEGIPADASCTSLRVLNLKQTGLTAAAARILAECPAFAQLQTVLVDTSDRETLAILHERFGTTREVKESSRS